jgi:hypothetical protein
MCLTFTGAVGPLARVPFLSAADVLIVKVLHQPIHVPEVAGGASIPSTYGDLIGTLAAVVIFLVGTQDAEYARGVRDIAGAI